MKILAFSDLHLSAAYATALVTASAQADLVIGAGDFCNGRQGLDQAMQMLDGIKTPFVTVPGNAESADELRAAALPGMTVLHGEGVEIDGLQLFGLGYGVPETPFGGWSCDLSEAEADLLLERCTQVDILISHSPPKGQGDVTSQGHSVGSKSVFKAVQRLQPKLVLFGHVHDCWGFRGRIGQSLTANVGPEPSFFEVTP
ncbi:Calcineurin-like phosphoesterase superfamily domain protein [Phaeobacter sp. CECT 5382]|uniref:metallophosphoesterase family protein n=1 Tax=Phaeobacter sp. CECT 5382 TaxID=1712645 RepID=UPI0006DA7F12|nr:metallophosphoesterase [Phaeobacter sp. CECT 5382]CUH87739.1 Calcineurin-like phosphoesterase superfamily domain protein [Phaeobacter sp. CECT 5382]